MIILMVEFMEMQEMKPQKIVYVMQMIVAQIFLRGDYDQKREDWINFWKKD